MAKAPLMFGGTLTVGLNDYGMTSAKLQISEAAKPVKTWLNYIQQFYAEIDGCDDVVKELTMSVVLPEVSIPDMWRAIRHSGISIADLLPKEPEAVLNKKLLEAGLVCRCGHEHKLPIVQCHSARVMDEEGIKAIEVLLNHARSKTVVKGKKTVKKAAKKTVKSKPKTKTKPKKGGKKKKG